MIARVWITLGLMAVGAAAFAVLGAYQRRRATVAVRAEGHSAGPRNPQVLYFWSETCTSCATQSRLFERLNETSRAMIRKVNVDRDRDTASAYGVLTVPTILVVDTTGQVRHANYGVVSPKRLAGQLEGL